MNPPGANVPAIDLHQLLLSEYQFRPGAPLKDFILSYEPGFPVHFTFQQLLMSFKVIIRDHEFFDFKNPTIIVCPEPLRQAINMSLLPVGLVRWVMYPQIILATETNDKPFTKNPAERAEQATTSTKRPRRNRPI